MTLAAEGFSSPFVAGATILLTMTLTRRAFRQMSFTAVLLFAFISTTLAQSPSYVAYIGTYTTKTASKGIYSARYDATNGRFTKPEVAAPTVDPSFLAVHPNGKFLYAVNEAGKASLVSA